ncbi:polymerase [Apocheima cinerarium nucleopolyhedrovirus]|uniref:polymerase n=1 Tax=Apocheima cinerarium nucleopolyhedrovirus TaxID=307461 RepID=UPI0001D92085|nr:polymerase [Apocheima cinerarium nucleopolyhedrovirus]ADB84407.1 polymerase [Apocheima cinerarium nucleopolyhedrovirus]
MTTSSSVTANINLMKWETLKSILCKQNQLMEIVEIYDTDVFRITKMAYKDGYLLMFLTGYTRDNDKKVFQFFVETKCDLYSYRTCYNDHAFNNCRNDCKSYKTFVMPGLKNVHMEKLNVVKYKRDNKSFIKKKPLDFFLRDINRIHMQTDLKEGQYVRFNNKQQCVNNRLKCIANDLDTLKTMFTILPAEELKREIVPVISSFDIETHSNGQKFSNANENPIMSISLVTRRDKKNLKICLYFMQGLDDLNSNENDNKNIDDIIAIRFENELDMLKSFFELLPLLNPDYLIDYNGDKFDIPYIVDRIKLLCVARKNFVNTVSSSKRLKYSSDNVTAEKIMKICRYDLEPINIETQVLHDKFGNKLNNHLLTYYVHVDLYQFLSNDSEHKNLENFQLNTVAEHYLKTNKVDLSILEMLKLYNANCIQKIIEYNVQDSMLTIDLFQKLEIIDFLYTQCMLLYLSTDDLLCNISHKINVVFFNLCITNTTLVDGKKVSDPFMFNKNDLSITSGRKSKFYNNENNEENDTKPDTLDLSLLKRKAVAISDIPSDAVKLCSVKGSSALEGGFVIEPISGLKKWVVTLDFNSLYLTIMMDEGACCPIYLLVQTITCI